MPKRTLELLKLLAEKGFPDECFRRIHHLGTSLTGHKDYCETRKNFDKSTRGDPNRLVSDRLEFILQQADIAASQGRPVNFAKLTDEAISQVTASTKKK